MLDLPALHPFTADDIETLHSEALASRSGAHRPRLTAAEIEAFGSGSIPVVRNHRPTISRFWDPDLGPQFLDVWLTLAERHLNNPAFLREAQALSFLRDIHDLGARPGLASGRTLRQSGGESGVMLPTFRPETGTLGPNWIQAHGHPITIPQSIWSDVVSHAAQKGIVNQPSGPFARNPSLRHIQFSADPTRGGADGILRFLKWLEQALPQSVSLIPPTASVIPRAPFLRDSPGAVTAEDPRPPRQRWLYTEAAKPGPTAIPDLDESHFADTYSELEADPSTARPSDISPVIQPRRELDLSIESPSDTRGDDVGELSRGDSVKHLARQAYRRAAYDYLEAYRNSDPSIDIPDPRTLVLDPEQLPDTATAISQTNRLRALIAKSRGKTVSLDAVNDSDPLRSRGGWRAHTARASAERRRQESRTQGSPLLRDIEDLAKTVADDQGPDRERLVEALASSGEDASPRARILPERIPTTETRPTEWVETGPRHGIPPSEARFLRVLKPPGHTPRAVRKDPTLEAHAVRPEELSPKPARDGSHGSPMTDEQIRRFRIMEATREALRQEPPPPAKAADRTPSKPRVLSGHVIRGKPPKTPKTEVQDQPSPGSLVEQYQPYLGKTPEGPGGAHVNRLLDHLPGIERMFGPGQSGRHRKTSLGSGTRGASFVALAPLVLKAAKALAGRPGSKPGYGEPARTVPKMERERILHALDLLAKAARR